VHVRFQEPRSDVIIAADRDGVIRFWNPGAERLFGHSADETLGRSLDLSRPAFRLCPLHDIRHTARDWRRACGQRARSAALIFDKRGKEKYFRDQQAEEEESSSVVSAARNLKFRKR
jgi:PAS domain S-box-containing protein